MAHRILQPDRRMFFGVIGAGAAAATAHALDIDNSDWNPQGVSRSALATLKRVAVTSINWIEANPSNPGPGPFAALSIPVEMVFGQLGEQNFGGHWNRRYREYLQQRNPARTIATLQGSGTILRPGHVSGIQTWLENTDPLPGATDWVHTSQQVQTGLTFLAGVFGSPVKRAQIACTQDPNNPNQEVCSMGGAAPTPVSASSTAAVGGAALGVGGAIVAGSSALADAGMAATVVGTVALTGWAIVGIGLVLAASATALNALAPAMTATRCRSVTYAVNPA